MCQYSCHTGGRSHITLAVRLCDAHERFVSRGCDVFFQGAEIEFRDRHYLLKVWVEIIYSGSMILQLVDARTDIMLVYICRRNAAGAHLNRTLSRPYDNLGTGACSTGMAEKN